MCPDEHIVLFGIITGITPALVADNIPCGEKGSLGHNRPSYIDICRIGIWDIRSELGNIQLIITLLTLTTFVTATSIAGTFGAYLAGVGLC